MIYAGQEYGEDGPRTIDFQPLHWEKLQLQAHNAHRAVVERLIRARREHTALRSDCIEFDSDNFAVENIVRFKRRPATGERDYAAVALNFGGVARPVILSLPWPGAWRDVVNDQVHQISGHEIVLSLGPWRGVLLTPVLDNDANCN
jgi:1,4-alpha-glucan branching enzyme